MDPEWASKQNSSNFEDELLAVKSSTYRLFFECLYSLTAFLALIGNCIVIAVCLFGKRSAPNLRKYLINLAVSDMLIGVFTVPFIYTDFMYGQWIFPHWLCPFSQFIQVVSVFITSFTLTNIGLERFAATLYPFSNINRWLKTNGNIILCFGWLLAAALGMYPLLYTKATPLDNNYNNITYFDCKINKDMDEYTVTYTQINFVLTFLLPLIVMIATYGTIGVQLFYYNSPSISDHQIDKIKIFKMLLAVVVIFFVCWFPIKTFILLFRWLDLTDLNSIAYHIYVYGFFTFYWLAMANSFVNPIIYCFMSKNFRGDLVNIFLNLCERFGILFNDAFTSKV